MLRTLNSAYVIRTSTREINRHELNQMQCCISFTNTDLYIIIYLLILMHFTCDRAPALLLLPSELVSDGNGTAGPTPHVGKRSVKFSEGALDDDCRNQYILILLMLNQIIKTHTTENFFIFQLCHRDNVVFMLLSSSHSHPSHML